MGHFKDKIKKKALELRNRAFRKLFGVELKSLQLIVINHLKIQKDITYLSDILEDFENHIIDLQVETGDQGWRSMAQQTIQYLNTRLDELGNVVIDHHKYLKGLEAQEQGVTLHPKPDPKRELN